MADRITAPGDLATVPVIRDVYSPHLWEAWLAANGLDNRTLGDGPAFSGASLCLDAAVADQGVFLAWETLAHDALAMGRLVAPLPGRRPAGDAYWFITGAHAPKPMSVRAFETWLRGEMEAE